MFLCDLCIPSKVVTIRTNDPPWFHNELRKSLRQRRRAYNLAKLSHSNILWTQYKQLRNKTTSLIRTTKQHYFQTLASQIHNTTTTTTTTDFLKTMKIFVNPVTTSKDLPALVHNGTIYETNQDKANIPNSYCQSQTLLQAPLNPTFSPLSPNTHILEDFDITIQDVTDSI